MYEIITRDDCELIKRVYRAQKDSPSQGDFINLVKSDFDFIGISFNEDVFCQMSQIQYKSMIHKKLYAAGLNEFTLLQAQHSKVRDIPYKDLSLQIYLKCSDFSRDDCQILTALRSHSLQGIKANFSSVHKNDMSCPLKCECSTHEDNQIHLMSCKSIFARLDRKYIEQTQNIKYTDIYGEPHSQREAARHLSTILDVRRNILEELRTSTASTSGPSLDTTPPASQGSSGD